MKFENMEDVKSGLPVKRKTSSFLGWELDLELFYKSFDGFGSGLQYGVFFPGSAFGLLGSRLHRQERKPFAHVVQRTEYRPDAAMASDRGILGENRKIR